MSLIEEAFPNKDPIILRKLWGDAEARMRVLERIGAALYDSTQKVFTQDPTNQLIALISQAQFPHKDEECIHVTGLMMKFIRAPDVLPYASLHFAELRRMEFESSNNTKQLIRAKQHFGGQCLVSLSFFYDSLKRRQKAGGPPPEWYRSQGKIALYYGEMEAVTWNFEHWEAYLNERLN